MSVGVKAEKERIGFRLTPELAEAVRQVAFDSRPRRDISQVVEEALRANPVIRHRLAVLKRSES